MKAVVFLGPTLPRANARALLDAEYRDPAAQGDIYRAARDGARIIGLVDGVFQSQPAVWHKEILWALSRRVHVLGAASMGALRAAELHRCGMRGVGRVFRRYRDGDIVPDDEVALIHAPAALGHVPLSEALVDIRATISAAHVARIVDGSEADALDGLATAMFYADRTWPAILAAARRNPRTAGCHDALAGWLATGRVSVKASDARRLLRVIGVIRRHRLPPPPPPPFVETQLWKEMVTRIENPFLRLLGAD